MVYWSLFPVSAVLVRRHSKQTHELTITVSSATLGLGNAQRIDCVNASRRLDAEDLSPLQAVFPIELRPAELANLTKGVNCRISLRLLQAKKVPLKNRTVQV